MSKLTYRELNITEPEEGIIEFEVLPEHLKLLRGAFVAWEDTQNGWGTFQVNPETPYGSKYICRDISVLLDEGASADPFGDEERYRALHKGAAMALQIFLKTGKFKAARYRANKYSQDWKEYKPKGKAIDNTILPPTNDSE
jgi:hypothetical protein